MIMRAIFANAVHTVKGDALPHLRELFAHANDTPYDLVAVTGEKCFEDGVAGPPVVTVYGDFLGCSVTCGQYLRLLAVHRDHRGRGIGTELVREAYARGARVVGAEAGNYFTPGAPLALFGFFDRFGHKTAETQNLICKTPLPASGERVAEGRVRGAILDFIKKEFGKIWHFEAQKAQTLHYIEEAGEIAGFAAHSANNRPLGFFGPTGVAKHLRGRGYGARLLLASLADMRVHGFETAIIPWTDALEFYRKTCGATVHGRFATFTLEDA
ncbi:MAG TPA: GNAT family N-acetyltransferase [Thermoanaerobaculia bacterium]|nr:GNAT family N-acetyltransferase [Thermoanaerobaculia bacterium]